jgi:hypothetical protein
MNDSERAVLYKLGKRVLCLRKVAGLRTSIADRLIAEQVTLMRCASTR